MKIKTLRIRESQIEYVGTDGYLHLATKVVSEESVQRWKDMANKDGACIDDSRRV